MELDGQLAVAKKAAIVAGDIHIKYFNNNVETSAKGKSYDLVTTADIESEQAIKAVLRAAYPEYGYVGEEEGRENSEAEFVWVIDPLDGTNNFASGMPHFCVSIALAYKGQSVLGVVYDTNRRELFWATQGGGAYLNDKKITCSAQRTLAGSLLITGFYYSRGLEMQQTLDKIAAFFKQEILGIRRLGSAALDLCYVASGRATGFWEYLLGPWDFAAGKIIVEEAGGLVTDNSGDKVSSLERSFIVSSNGNIHSQMLAVLAE